MKDFFIMIAILLSLGMVAGIASADKLDTVLESGLK